MAPITTGPVDTRPVDPAAINEEAATSPTTTPPRPAVSAADAPEVTPSVGDVLSGVRSPEAMAQRVQRPATPATFKGTLRESLAGPRYTTDANGNIVPAVQTDKYGNPVKTSLSMRGILAGILAGAAQGAVGGMAAERRPGENPYSAGARGAVLQAKERDERARNIAQRNYENRQKQQQLNIEQAKQMDEHTTRLLTNAKITQETIAMEHESRYMDEMHPLLEAGEKAKLSAALVANRKNFDELAANLIEAVGPDAVEFPGAGHGVLTPDHARNAAQGHGPMYGTENHDGEFGLGAVDYDMLENSPLKKDVPVYKNVIDPKTGAVSKQLMTTIRAGEPAYKALDVYNSGMAEFHQQYDIYAKGLDAQAKKAEIPLKQAEAGRAQAETGKAVAETAALGTQPGGAIDTQARALVEGNMDPSQLSKRANTYGATLAAADKYSRDTYGRPFDIAQAQSDYTYAKTPANQNTLKMIQGMIEPGGAIDIAQNAAKAIPKVDVQTMNRIFNTTSTEFGNPALTNFHTAMLGLADEYSKVMGGGVSSDTGRQQALDILKDRYSRGQLDGAIGIMRQDIAARRKALIGDNRYLQKQYPVASTQQQTPQLTNLQSDGKTTIGWDGKQWIDTTTNQPYQPSAPRR